MSQPLRPQRPEAAPQSAVSVESKCRVQHRSDLLMKQQVQRVHSAQEAMKQAISGLEAATSPAEVEQWTATIEQVKDQAEQMVLIFQVMSKLNTELAYARADLTTALYNHTGNINAARKRVIWLEDKMGELCRKQCAKEKQEHPILPVLDERASDEAENGIQEQINEAENKGEEIDADKETDEKENEEETGDEDDDEETSDEDVEETDAENDEEADDFAKSGSESGEQHSERDGDGDYQKAFMTEFTTDSLDQRKVSSAKQVTIQSPAKETSTEPESAVAAYWESEHHRFEYSSFCPIAEEVDPLSYHTVGLATPGSFLQKNKPDFAELPWKTVLTAKDIKDIHREALDKLAGRVHGMQDKIYDASMLSVLPQPPPPPTQASLTQNIDKLSTEPKAKHQPGMPVKGQSSPGVGRQRKQTDESVRSGASSGAETPRPSKTRHLVFYPKPIPPPQVLPITRTNPDKEFPQACSSFAKPAPDERPAAERVANQRNLLQETRLVLYRQKPAPQTPQASAMEKHFTRMIDSDAARSRKSTTGRKLRSQFKMAAAVSSVQAGAGMWRKIKPRSKGKEYQGLRWERVKTIVHQNLNSLRVEERGDAAKQLGLLRCGDTMVFYALKERLRNDPVPRVQYEATKALILIGCWDDEVLKMVLKFLVLGNTESRIDLINTLIQGKNVMFVDKSVPSFVELAKVLSHLCRNPDPADQIAFDAAVLLGRLCVRDAHAESRLVKALVQSSDTHLKAKAVEVLVRQLGRVDETVVQHIITLLTSSPVWKHRVLAANLLISLGPKQTVVLERQEEIYSLLTRRLWDEPNSEVRLSAAKALAALGMFARACEAVENGLEDREEEVRAPAVISVGTLGLKNERVIRLLLEMLELDSSEYVRLMIIRTFAALKLTDRRVLRTLREREKQDGSLARESKKALLTLDCGRSRPASRSASSRDGSHKAEDGSKLPTAAAPAICVT